jgi:clan AA aspartic protease (TIGR02281 family)
MHKNFSIAVLTSVFLFGFVLQLNADTLYLKNGRSIEGLIKTEDDQSIELEVGFGTVKFSKSQIERIQRTNARESALIQKKWDEAKQKVQDQEKEERLKKELGPKQVDIQQQSGHVIVDAVINKKVNASLVLDTGASYVVLSNSIAKKIDPDIDRKEGKNIEMTFADGRKTNAKFMLLESLSTQGVEAEKVAAAILPEDASSANFKDGLLGMSFLKNFTFKVDQKNNKLVLEKLQ